MLPAQADQFALAHGGFQRQPDNRQQKRIACLAAGLQQTGFFTFFAILAGLQAPVTRLAVRGQFDVAHGVMDVDAPFLAGHFEHMTKDGEIPFHGGRWPFFRTWACHW